MKGFLASLENLLRPILEKLGVDYAQYRTLVQVSLWLDFRNSGQAMGMRSESSPLPAALLWYGVMSGFLSLMAFAMPAEAFARLMLMFGMLILGMAMLIDFGVTLILPTDLGVVGWRPISSRTYFAARLTNALFYVVMFCAALELVPSAMGAFSKRAPLTFPLVFFPCALLGGLFMAGVIAASYATLLKTLRQERFRDVANFFQIALMVLFLAGSQLFPRMEAGLMKSGRLAGGAAPEWSWWDALPSRWFAAPVEVLIFGPTFRGVFLSALGIVATLGLFYALVRTLSISYLEKIGQVGAPAADSRRLEPGVKWLPPLMRLWLRAPEERAMFDFVRRILARDRQVRLRLYPSLAYLFVFLAGYLATQRQGAASVGQSLSPVMILFIFCFLPLTLLMQLPYSGESQGAWIFDLARFEKPARAAAGIKKCLAACVFLPVAVLVFALLSFFGRFADAAGFVTFGLVGGLFVLELEFLLFFEGLPFTRPIRTGVSAMGYVYMVPALALGGALYLLTRVFLKTPGQLFLGGLALLPVLWVVHQFSNSRYRPMVIAAPEAAEGNLKLMT